MLPLISLETPALLLDHARLSANIVRMHAHLGAAGVPLRPHVKTAKSIEVARAMSAGQSAGITVSTLEEADFFAQAGFLDVIYAVGIAPSKIAHASRLVRGGVDLKLLLDCGDAATHLAERALQEDVTFPVMIEIDCDGHRSGVAPDAIELIDIGRVVATSQRLKLVGVLAHAGASYESESIRDIQDAAERERTGLVHAAARLRSAGFNCPIVSAGSTPTAVFGRSYEGLTEVRAGVFVFNDLMISDLGASARDDIALSVLVSVIGRRREGDWIITDGGWAALSPDGGNGRHGYGLVADEYGTILDGLNVIALNQEHGIIARADGGAIESALFPYGRRLRIVPNHACATASCFSRYAVLSDGKVSEFWERLSARA